MKTILSSLIGALLTVAASAAPEVVQLWPGTAPGETGPMEEVANTSKPTDRGVAGRPVVRTGNVGQPTLTFYAARGAEAAAPAVLICPGGGYNILAWDLEGEEVAQWLNGIGVHAFLLKYRVPVRKNRPRFEAPLQDAQRAMGLIRSRAAQWRVNPEKLGVLGFSAGGHLSAALSCQDDTRTYPKVDAADEAGSRPNFTVLVYPAYLVDKTNYTQVSPELKVSSRTPPTFIVQTQDDGIPVEGSIGYYLALKAAKVPTELHLFAKGGHGYGLRETSDAVTGWPRLTARWFQTIGALPATK
jgi:acetyl esterase/lipase